MNICRDFASVTVGAMLFVFPCQSQAELQRQYLQLRTECPADTNQTRTGPVESAGSLNLQLTNLVLLAHLPQREPITCSKDIPSQTLVNVPSNKDVPSNQELADQIAAAIKRSELRNYRLDLSVEKGVVTIEGQLASHADLNNVNLLLSTNPNVVAIINKTNIIPDGIVQRVGLVEKAQPSPQRVLTSPVSIPAQAIPVGHAIQTSVPIVQEGAVIEVTHPHETTRTMPSTFFAPATMQQVSDWPSSRAITDDLYILYAPGVFGHTGAIVRSGQYWYYMSWGLGFQNAGYYNHCFRFESLEQAASFVKRKGYFRYSRFAAEYGQTEEFSRKFIQSKRSLYGLFLNNCAQMVQRTMGHVGINVKPRITPLGFYLECRKNAIESGRVGDLVNQR